MNTGNLYIVAAPSGGGKSSLVSALVQQLDSIRISISHTTRPIRAGEQEGVDYFFISEAAFKDMIEANAFIEHAQVFNYYYGTSAAQIHDNLNQGIDVILDIDWQGAKQMKLLFPSAVTIFVIPPSLEELRNRLQNRKREDADVISYRMQEAQNELKHYVEFDYLLVNDNFDHALQELKAIVVADRLCLERQANKLQKLLTVLLT